MQWYEVCALGVGLSFDAMVVAIGTALCMGGMSKKQGLSISSSFGFFQAFMPLIGFYLGRELRPIVQPIDHWIAFLLLLFIAVNMFKEGWELREKGPDCPLDPESMLKSSRLLILSIATSIDAMAAGLSLSVAQIDSIWEVVLVVGVSTFLLSLLGALLASRFSNKFQFAASVCGGLILLAIGTKTLIENLVNHI